MFEQFGPYYRQGASEIQDPTNNTYERLWRDISGTFYIRHSDGTDELFSTAIGVTTGMNFQGGFDASAGIFPTIPLGSGPLGAIAIGDTFVITVAGTLGGIPMQVGDLIIARVNNAGNVGADWVQLEMAGAFVPYVGANATVDLNTQTLIAGAMTLGIAAGSSILTLRNTQSGKQLSIVANVAGFNDFTLTLGTVGSLTDFVTSAPAFSMNKDLRFNTAGRSNIYVNNGGNGIHISGRNDVSGNFGITILDDGTLQLATDTKGFATLVGGTVTVATTKVTATSKIMLTVNGSLGIGVAVGVPYIETRIAGTSFTINSNDLLGNLVATDVREVMWTIVE